MTTATIIIEIALALILIIAGIKGYVDGFLKSVLSFIAVVLAVGAGFFGGRWLSQLIFDSFIEQRLVTKLSEQIYANSQTGTAIKLFLGLQNKIDLSGLVTSEMTQQDCVELSTKVVNASLRPAITGIITVVLFIIIFAIVMLILGKLAKASKKAGEGTVVGGVNKVLGIILGLALGIVACIALVAAFQYMKDNIKVFDFVTQEELDSTFLYKLFSKINLFELISPKQ